MSILLIGCASDNQKYEEKNDELEEGSTEQVTPESKDEKEKSNEKDEKKSDESGTTELSVEKETADEIAKDDNVEDAIIQLETVGENEYVNAHIKFKEVVKGEETAEEYADQLKEQYPDRIVDIILSRNGDVLYQGVFE
ncbi:hypothetical protein [Sporosarcina sp.]|uniref:hypothetical protein n=1 Tax=Sporosarcina sp. TaxID=49982 RepID=UPI002634CC6A|nr:hypothetical protein [Sporosarcina sp.]